jgi:hypothetical protein
LVRALNRTTVSKFGLPKSVKHTVNVKEFRDIHGQFNLPTASKPTMTTTPKTTAAISMLKKRQQIPEGFYE